MLSPALLDIHARDYRYQISHSAFLNLDTLVYVSPPLLIHSGFSVLALSGFPSLFLHAFCLFSVSHKFIPLSRAGGTSVLYFRPIEEMAVVINCT